AALTLTYGQAFSQQQSASTKMTASISAAQIHEEATLIEKKAGPRGWDFLSKAKTETPYQKRMLDQCRKGKAIVDRVIRRGNQMTDAEAAQYDAQMKEIVETMDTITGGTQASGSQGECFGGCDNQYKGWGKGKGWNRFWCKVS